jgi:hypothetical protein
MDQDERAPAKLIEIAGRNVLYDHLKQQFGDDEEYKKILDPGLTTFVTARVHPRHHLQLCTAKLGAP